MIALQLPAEWARLVSGLDPLTAHVITTQWEAAGGAASMPDFYRAIFGGGELPPRMRGVDEGSGADDQPSKSSVDSGASDAAGKGVESAPEPRENAGAQLQQQQPPRQEKQELGQHQIAQARVAGRQLGRSRDWSGVALRERLIRLKQRFAQEEFSKLLSEAVGR